MNQRKFDKLAEMALPYALGSSRKKKHVSLILVRNNIISVGTNQLKSHPRAKKIGYRYDEVHSELDALLRCKERKNLELVNFRFNRFGDLRVSCPCSLCCPWCKLIFDKIYYTTPDGYTRLEY
jgi:deoxycytidylate deaminase